MVAALDCLASAALRVALCGELGPAEVEGYLPEGCERTVANGRPAAEGALVMPLAWLSGALDRTEAAIERSRAVLLPPCVRAVARPKSRRGHRGRHRVQPDPERRASSRVSTWVVYPIAGHDYLTDASHESIRGGFVVSCADQDYDCILRLDAQRPLRWRWLQRRAALSVPRAGGERWPDHHDHRFEQEISGVPEEHGAETGPPHRHLTHGPASRCYGGANEPERSGIPTVLITAMASLAERGGSPRLAWPGGRPLGRRLNPAPHWRAGTAPPPTGTRHGGTANAGRGSTRLQGLAAAYGRRLLPWFYPSRSACAQHSLP
jgi:glycine/betaine/sarcosine/D-proline reductase family selenoprotein B